MGFLRQMVQKLSKPSQTLIDPTFGEMSPHRGAYVSGMIFPHARELVEVSVWGEEGPSAYQRGVWQTLVRQYAEIDPWIEEALYAEVGMALNSDDPMAINDLYLSDETRPTSPADVWKIAHPVSIDIYPEGYSQDYDCRIYYAFPIDREHNRSVFLQDGKPVFVLPE